MDTGDYNSAQTFSSWCKITAEDGVVELVCLHSSLPPGSLMEIIQRSRCVGEGYEAKRVGFDEVLSSVWKICVSVVVFPTTSFLPTTVCAVRKNRSLQCMAEELLIKKYDYIYNILWIL